MEKVKVTDLGRGAKVILDKGWEATLEDDKKNSITRLVNITLLVVELQKRQRSKNECSVF